MSTKVVFGVVIVNYLFVISANGLMDLNMASEKYPFNRRFYEDALDPDLCQRQLTYLTRDNQILLSRFLDAGIRIPRGILTGNTVDLGNFHQCLAIHEKVETEDMVVSGKYCRIRVPMKQDLHWPNFFKRSIWKNSPAELEEYEKMLKLMKELRFQQQALKSVHFGTDSAIRVRADSPLSEIQFQLAICIPRPCSTEQAINGRFFNFTNIGFEYSEVFCRLSDDRPWVAADYVATIVFAIIGAFTLISTAYDLYQTIYLKKGPKEIKAMYSSFSVYTNTRRLLTFNSNPGSLECLDGIRALAIFWVILGHIFLIAMQDMVNPIEGFLWVISPRGFFVTVAPLTVDTFFLLSGLLLVYTMVGKISREKLLKNIHVFYLLRLLRMFPILAAVILFEASFYLRASDGPLWNRVAFHTFKCREYWWSTLLHLQNIVNPMNACVAVSWYLAIDVQLHILSPLILFWVLTSKRAAWTALNISFIATLIASTVYIFFRNFPSGILSPNVQDPLRNGYHTYYYVNVLTRASPFLVGMGYGYLIHLWKNKKAYVPKIMTIILLLLSLLTLLLVMYCAQIATRLDWENQLADNIFNSFLRPLWALALGWIIFACVQGRAEPINWFLSLHLWKLPARVSYAMYLIHFIIVESVYSSIVAPIYFSVPSALFTFLACLFLTILISFIVTLLIDSPFSTIFKLLLGSPKKSTPKLTIKENVLPKVYEKKTVGNGKTVDDADVTSTNLKTVNGNIKININRDYNTIIEEESKSKEN